MRTVRPTGSGGAAADREALLAFVDVCQVLIGRIEASGDTAVRELMLRVLQRAAHPARPPAAEPVPETRPSRQPATSFRVVRVLRFLEEHFADPAMHLTSAARHVDVTPSHLDRLLKGHTGLTFLQQLRRIRMRHAERLLLTTAMSIKETAFACGYASAGSFDRDFRRTHSSPPRAWREQRMVSTE
jgi:transcriptional regulator GlxA family with amidase domain